jgi:hypothetical protein
VARNWLGLPGDITITEPLYGVQNTIYTRDDKEAGDCAGVVAMKIAAAKKAKALGDEAHGSASRDEMRSGALPEEYNGNGRINWKGAIGISIGYLVFGPCGNLGAEAMMVYVAVSGGTQDEDELAASAAIPVIREIMKAEHDGGWILARDFWDDDPVNEESDIAEPDRNSDKS